MTEQQLRLNEMYHVYNQTHHPILKMLLLMTINILLLPMMGM